MNEEKIPEQIYLVKAWSDTLEGHTIMRAYRNRSNAELFIDCQIQLLYITSKDNPDEFEIETGYSVEYFNNEESMLSMLRTLFHVERVELY